MPRSVNWAYAARAVVLVRALTMRVIADPEIGRMRVGDVTVTGNQLARYDTCA